MNPVASSSRPIAKRSKPPGAKGQQGRPAKKCGIEGCVPCGTPVCHECKGCKAKHPCVKRQCQHLKHLQDLQDRHKIEKVCSHCKRTFKYANGLTAHIQKDCCGHASKKYKNFLHKCDCRSGYNRHKEIKKRSTTGEEKLEDHSKFKMRCETCKESITLKKMAQY